MTTLKQVYYLLLAIAGIVFLPYIGSWLYADGSYPADFFEYPPLSAPAKAGFNIYIFLGVAVCGLVVTLLYVFPRLFGFRQVVLIRKEPVQPTPLPIWFWVGLVIWGVPLALLWAKVDQPKWLLNWAYLPLFWGFTLMLDGWVYIRSNGASLLRKYPREIVGIGVAATSGWMLFEYLNFFVDENWFYPKGDIVPDDEFTVYATLGSSGLMPAVFELYELLNTFRFRHRFDNGPKISLPRNIRIGILVLALFGMFAIGYFPDGMFMVLWVSPLMILSVVLTSLGIWTPFTPIKDGNWSPVLKYALTYLIYGFLLEWWNYFNSTHPDDPAKMITFTPAHWVYSLPYVNRFHVFEMPVLGYMGYLPFGIYCAIWWISFAFLLNIPTQFARDGQSPFIPKL